VSEPGLLGVHWLADATGCRAEALADPERIADLLVGLAADAGLTPLGEPLVQPTASGLVGMLLLAESHASAHTDRVARTAFVDVFSCVAIPTEGFTERVTSALGATSVRARTVARGPA